MAKKVTNKMAVSPLEAAEASSASSIAAPKSNSPEDRWQMFRCRSIQQHGGKSISTNIGLQTV